MRLSLALTPWYRAARLGAVVGAIFGAWDLIATRVDPLAEDTSAALLTFYGPMFAVWALAGVAVGRRTGRLSEAAKAGALVALATFTVFSVLVLVRVNVFLESLLRRTDWQGLLRRYQESDFGSFRTYANYTYAVTAPVKLLVASAIGAAAGALGGAVERARRAATGR